jgi:transposase
MADITPEDVLLFKCNFRLRTASVGGVVYTAPYRNYRTLVCCGSLPVAVPAHPP